MLNFKIYKLITFLFNLKITKHEIWTVELKLFTAALITSLQDI